MKKLLFSGLLIAGLSAASSAHADGFSFRIFFGNRECLPPPPVVVAPHCERPVYGGYEEPVYAPPPQVVYVPRECEQDRYYMSVYQDLRRHRYEENYCRREAYHRWAEHRHGHNNRYPSYGPDYGYGYGYRR